MKKLLIALMVAVPLAAKYHKVTSSQEFKRLVDNYRYSVACFIPDVKNDATVLDSEDLKERKKDIKSMQDSIQAAASKSDFRRFLSKDVGFIAVDVGSKRTQGLVDEFHVGQDVICYAFEEGAVNPNFKVTNPSSAKELIDLLEESGGKDLQELLLERKEEQTEDRQERIARYYAYGGYYPYGWGNAWGGSSYWARPYWGWYTSGPVYF